MANNAEIIITAKDKTKAAINSTMRGLKGVKDQVFSLKTAFAAIGIGVVSREFIKAASTTEEYRVRLRALLGSVQEGNRLFDDMSRFASKVPFEFEQIMGSATQLSGVMKGGVDEINQWMPMIADLAAVSGLSIQQTTEQVARMYSAGANSADLFRERGILSMLGFQAGVSVSVEETRKTMMEAWTKADSQFHGASMQLATTWTGLMSMLSDKWFQFRNSIMSAGLFDYIKSVASVIDQRLGKAMSGSGDLAKTVSDSIITFFERAIVAGARAVDLMTPIMTRIKEALNSIWEGYKALPGWAQEVGIIGALIGGKKGKAVLVGLALVSEEWKTAGEWWAAYSQDQITFGEWIQADTDAAKAKLKEIKKDWQDTTGTTKSLAEKLFDPSTAQGQAELFLQEVRSTFNKIREEANNVGTGKVTKPDFQGQPYEDDLATFGESQAKLQEKMQQRLDSVALQLMTEEERLSQSYVNREMIINEAFENGLIEEERRKDLLLQLNEQYNNKLLTDEQRTQQAMTTLWNSSMQGKLQITGQVMGQLANLMQSGSKKQFEVGKKAAMAQAVIDTYQMAVASYNALAGIPIVGPALGAVAAAAAIMYGKAQIDRIKSQQFGGGAVAAGTFAASPNTGLPTGEGGGSPGNVSGLQQQQAAPPAREVNITLSGTSYTRDQVRELIEQINEETGDGVALRANVA